MLLFFLRIFYNSYYEGKEVAVMSYGGRSRHLKWCHIRTKTEQLSGRNKNCIRLHLFFLREIRNLYYGEMVSSYVRAALVTGMKKRITARTISLTL
jgi:hypothetical protein